jgi:hypothetical protein
MEFVESLVEKVSEPEVMRTAGKTKVKQQLPGGGVLNIDIGLGTSKGD